MMTVTGTMARPRGLGDVTVHTRDPINGNSGAMAGTDLPVLEQRRALEDALGALPLLARQLVQLLSLAHVRVEDAAMARCANRLGLRLPDGGKFSHSEVARRTASLASAGLVLREGDGCRCHPLLADAAIRAAVEDGTFGPLREAVCRCCPPYTTPGLGLSFGVHSRELALGQIRLAMYEGDVARVEAMHGLFSRRYGSREDLSALVEMFDPLSVAWFAVTSPRLWMPLLDYSLRDHLFRLAPPGEVLGFLEPRVRGDAPSGAEAAWSRLRLVVAEQLMAQGRPEEALSYLSPSMEAARCSFRGWQEVLRGDVPRAQEHYSEGLSLAENRGQDYFSSLAGPFHILALAASDDPDLQQAAAGQILACGRDRQYPYLLLLEPLEAMVAVAAGMPHRARATLAVGDDPEELLPLELIFRALAESWIDSHHAARLAPLLEPLADRAERGGYLLLASLASEVLGKMGSPSRAGHAAQLRRLWGGQPVLELVQARESWEHSLDALVDLARPALDEPRQERLVWMVSYLPGTRLARLEPRVQRVGKRGNWTRGRKVSPSSLTTERALWDLLTDQDRRVLDGLGNEHWYAQQLDMKRALPVMVGHPLVFWQHAPSERVELVAGTPELVVARAGDGVELTLVPSPFPSGDDEEPSQPVAMGYVYSGGNSSGEYFEVDELDLQRVVVELEGPGRLRITEFSDEHLRIARTLGLDGLTVPGHGERRVLDVIDAVSPSITIQSDIGAGDTGALAAAEPDCRPRFLLSPQGKGLRAQLWVRPLADGGPYYLPGEGGETVVAEVDGTRVRTRRDRETELELAASAVDRCPTLASEDPGVSQWALPELERSLEMLQELQDLGDDAVVEWPEGQRLKLRPGAGLSGLFLRINRKGDWFEAHGELRLDEQTVLQMQDLLRVEELASGRFFPLGDGEFVALTRDLRRRLGDLRDISEQRGEGLRFSPLAATALQDLAGELGGLETDDAWDEQLERIRRASEFSPSLPKTLHATLRDYQQEGFCWLARLAHWGVGACLADDMGLGKTVQALAVILARADAGPTLVVAPTSVYGNWEREANRFAPTLRVRTFAPRGRKELLARLGPRDLLVCSYGLLRVEAEGLTEVDWQTVVLDEAQAIKNAATKSSRAAMTLPGKFKLITTGTPIENHLGELWALFRFINPGLLGSRKSFDARFAVPMEKHGDKEARLRLRRLVKPFILRRTKSQVLEELPPRTEVLLDVRMGEEEAALYEALRREALQRLERGGAGGPGQMQVLAELTRLRRACCNPRLVVPDSTAPSAKLEAFKETLQGLMAGGHRALVFSQFVTHLALVRQLLVELEVEHQYLDGSTPAAERLRRVDAFQAGEGEVFLISLRAGGQGLNLTAADYVIHLDPWWNPAVEDQASDRAHRIGQHRPVTIYRLVVQGTIEEKIVLLHHEKRDLAQRLLEGTDTTGKLSAEELLGLLREG